MNGLYYDYLHAINPETESNIKDDRQELESPSVIDKKGKWLN